MDKKKTQTVNMVYPVDLLDKIEDFQKRHYFTTRSAAIIYLISKALNDLEKDQQSHTE